MKGIVHGSVLQHSLPFLVPAALARVSRAGNSEQLDSKSGKTSINAAIGHFKIAISRQGIMPAFIRLSQVWF